MGIVQEERPSVRSEPQHASHSTGRVTGLPVPSVGVRSLLASLGMFAAIIHLAMVPSHWDEWRPEGAAFAVAGWVQLGLALAAVTVVARRVVLATALVQLAAIGAWAVTRTSGWPRGPHAWHAESVTVVDLSVVVAEAALVVLCAPVLLGARSITWGAAWRAALVPPVLLAVGATAVLASPSARNHAHDAHGGHTHEDAAAEVPPSGAAAGAQADHDHGVPHADADADSDVNADDRGLSLLTNGHQHDTGEVDLGLQTQLRLDAQLAATLDVAARYPTVADAEAAGFRRAGPFSPGLGTHYTPPRFSMNDDGVMDAEELAWPTLIFDGWAPDSPIAGFMYQAYSADGAEPEGFVGPNDHWHYHTDVCIVIGPNGIDAPLGADRSATQAQCDRFGGVLIPRTGYMVHVWTVPGYESDRGIFSEVNPSITCPDGSYFMKDVDEYGVSPTTCRGEA